MSPDVRVHVRLGSLRLDYQGTQAFYEAHVEALIRAAAGAGVRGADALTATGSPGMVTRRFGGGLHPSRADLGHADLEDLGAHPASNGHAEPTRSETSEIETPEPTQGASGSSPTAAPVAFVPRSPEFGRYVQRLGPEAAEPDRQVVALAFYLWNYEHRETFGRPELAGCFQALHLPVPVDLPAILADLTDRKRFIESAGEGRWKLAKKGENYVKTRLLSI